MIHGNGQFPIFVLFLIFLIALRQVDVIKAVTVSDSPSTSPKTNLRATDSIVRNQSKGDNNMKHNNMPNSRMLQQQEKDANAFETEIDEHVTLPTDNTVLNPDDTISESTNVKYDDNLQYIDEEGRTCYMIPNNENGAKKLEWKTENGELFFNNKPFHLKGTSWFGFETPARMPHGLWLNDLDSILSFLKENKFNAIRLPFSVVLMHYYKESVQWNMPLLDQYLHGRTAIEMMELIVDKAAEYDILIMLDFHRINEQFIPELWYDQEMDMQKTMEAWDEVLTLAKGKWNVFALDLKNEPHGRATWGNGNEWTDWNLAAEKMATNIIENHPEFTGFFFVEGTQQANADNLDPNPKFWGGDLEGAIKNPISFGKYGKKYEEHESRIVYSPHVYGPDVYQMNIFWSGDFPNNMPAVWHKQWAFAEEETNKAVVISEWGGHNRPGSDDEKWHEALVNYMIENCLEDNFYWALNPNSGDTGGLLYDNYSDIDWKKLTLLDRVQPNPSKLSWGKDRKSVCYYEGEYVNEKGCNTRKYPELQKKKKNENKNGKENEGINEEEENKNLLNPIQAQVIDQPEKDVQDTALSLSTILSPIQSSTQTPIEEINSTKDEDISHEMKLHKFIENESMFANPKLRNRDTLYP